MADITRILDDLDPLSVSEVISGGSIYSNVPNIIYGLMYDLDVALGQDPEDESDRYGGLSLGEFKALCRSHGLSLAALDEALTERALYHSELADEAAYERAHGYY